MLLVGFLSWWYGAGWMQRLAMIRQRFTNTLDFFSPGLLLQTWFAPFRQIAAEQVAGSFGVLWRAFVDKLISRLVGAVVRTVLLIGALVVLCVQAVVAMLELGAWLILPLVPLVGLVLALSGWVPVWR